MHPTEPITLTRDCEAVAIPSGGNVLLPKGESVGITQSLGGTYTVAWSRGLARIDAKDVDALGMEPMVSAPVTSPDSNAEVSEAAVWDQLKNVFDPEIPVNIVDLGLVYSLAIKPLEIGGKRVDIKMTLTAPGCGMGPTIANDAKQRTLSIPGVTEAEVELVWDPPWNQEMITEPGRMKLGLV